MKTKQLLLFLIIIPAMILSCDPKDSPGTGNWVQSTQLSGEFRSEAVSFVINDTAYIGTGIDSTNRLNDLWQYVTINGTSTWTQKASMPGSARSSAVAFVAAGKGYVGTGFDGVKDLKDMWQFDPVTNAWIHKRDFAGSARHDAVAFGILDKGYIATGFDGNYLKDFYQYDPVNDSWTLQPDFKGSERMAAVAFVYKNKAYICTGTNGGTDVNDFWVYDPLVLSWTQLRSIANTSTSAYDDIYTNITRHNSVGFIIGNKAYISTGENSGGTLLTSTWEYDFATDLWNSKQDFEGGPRTGATAFSISLGSFVLTGRGNGGSHVDMRQFFPNEPYVASD